MNVYSERLLEGALELASLNFDMKVEPGAARFSYRPGRRLRERGRPRWKSGRQDLGEEAEVVPRELCA